MLGIARLGGIDLDMMIAIGAANPDSIVSLDRVRLSSRPAVERLALTNCTRRCGQKVELLSPLGAIERRAGGDQALPARLQRHKRRPRGNAADASSGYQRLTDKVQSMLPSCERK